MKGHLQHEWVAVYDEGECEEQRCKCGAVLTFVFDFQDGSYEMHFYPEGGKE